MMINAATESGQASATAIKHLIDSSDAQYTFLPSLLTIGKMLNCSAVEVYQAITELTRWGYDFLIPDFNSPITLRKPLGAS